MRKGNVEMREIKMWIEDKDTCVKVLDKMASNGICWKSGEPANEGFTAKMLPNCLPLGLHVKDDVLTKTDDMFGIIPTAIVRMEYRKADAVELTPKEYLGGPVFAGPEDRETSARPKFKLNDPSAVLERFNALKAMNTIILFANDERVISEWIEIIPDEVADDELMEIATDDPAIYRDACKEFRRLMRSDMMNTGGLYIGADVY